MYILPLTVANKFPPIENVHSLQHLTGNYTQTHTQTDILTYKYKYTHTIINTNAYKHCMYILPLTVANKFPPIENVHSLQHFTGNSTHRQTSFHTHANSYIHLYK
jgi:hypothetical protein